MALGRAPLRRDHLGLGLNQSSQPTGAPSGTPSSNSPVPVQIGTITVAVTPASASVVGGGTRAFTAVVAGAVNQAVTWTVQEQTGGADHQRRRTLHGSVDAGTYHVQAVSVAIPTKMGTAIVTVTAPNVLSTTVTSVTPNNSGLGYTVTLTGEQVIRGSRNEPEPHRNGDLRRAASGATLGTRAAHLRLRRGVDVRGPPP